MTWTFKLNSKTKDLIILPNGKLDRTNGSEEVRQRIIVAFGHYAQEYFINLPAGVPWYEEILGATGNSPRISNILRGILLKVPGVVQIVTFDIKFDTLSRSYNVESQVIVRSGPGDVDTDSVIIDGITIPIQR